MADRSRVAIPAWIALSLLAIPTAASAQEAPSQPGQETNMLYPRFRLGVGAFASFFNTTLRLDSEELGIGTEIDLEDDLGFDTKKFDFRTSGYLRLGRRHRIAFGYFNLTRSSNRVIDEDIQFGDEIFPVDTEVNADFKTEFVLLGYRFSFLARQKVEVAAALGMSAMFTKSGISAVGTIGDEDVDAVSERRSATFPVATLGLDATWAPLSRLNVRGAIGGLYVKISSVRASVGNANLDVEYFLTRNFGLGIGYAYTRLGVEETEDPSLEITYRYSGLLLYGVLVL